MIKKFFSNIKSMFSDERGEVSSKRVVGMLCAIFLCITLYANSFSEEHIAPSAPLVETVGFLAGACLGLTSLDKIFGKKQGKDETEPTN